MLECKCVGATVQGLLEKFLFNIVIVVGFFHIFVIYNNLYFSIQRKQLNENSYIQRDRMCILYLPVLYSKGFNLTTICYIFFLKVLVLLTFLTHWNIASDLHGLRKFVFCSQI